MAVYYNEFDPSAAAWLRELIAEGVIADGEVDTRSIVDVRPDDLRRFIQCHFFAGIGGWSLSLRLAGWPDTRPVWTGSCPCQPFSAAGKGKGTDDARHLWPEFRRLISECEPSTVFGEQVASKAGRAWLSGVFADLEGMGYRRAGADLCAAGVGAFHIRQRLWFVADSTRQQHDWGWCAGQGRRIESSDGGEAGELGNSDNAGPQGRLVHGERAGELPARAAGVADGEATNGLVGMHLRELELAGLGGVPVVPCVKSIHRGQSDFWDNAEWIPCRDGKARPVEPASERLADGLSADLGRVRLTSYPDRPHEERLAYAPLIKKGKARVMRLRGYGNAIVPQVAATVIAAYMETLPELSV